MSTPFSMEISCHVPPLAGGWVEIHLRPHNVQCEPRSPPSRAGGLKYILKKHIRIRMQRPAPRGGWLKYPAVHRNLIVLLSRPSRAGGLKSCSARREMKPGYYRPSWTCCFHLSHPWWDRPEIHPLRGPLRSRSRPSCLCLHSQAVLLQRPCLIPSSAGASRSKERFRLSSVQPSNGVMSYIPPGQQPFLPFLWSSTEQALGVPYSISPASAGSMDTRPSSKTKAGTPTSPISLQ